MIERLETTTRRMGKMASRTCENGSVNGRTIRVADAVAEALAAHGIDVAFGMPGGEVVTLLDALGRAGIRFVLARQETSAAIMAAGAFAAKGAPGLLVTTIGPGLANAVNGIADAVQERVPLIVISGVADHAVRARYTHQVLDHAALLRPLVKASFEIEAEGAGAAVARAIALACAEPMGPVHLDLAPGTALLAVKAEAAARPVRAVWPTPDASGAAVCEVRDLLAGAKRPLMIAGLEAVRSGAGEELQGLAERLQAPFITTYKAKGLIDEHHPLALGGAGLSPLADAELLRLVRGADAVLLAGYDPIEMRQGWLDPFAPDATVIELTAHPADHGMHQSHLRLGGDVRRAAEALLKGMPQGHGWSGGDPAKTRDRLRALFQVGPAWGPHAVFDALQAALPVDATVTADSGAHRILLSQQLLMARPNALLQSAGFCTMGAAVPLAIGFASARAGARVVAVLGDGGLEMCLGELGTVRDQQLPLVIVVLQDQSLALIELKQGQAGLERAGVRLGPTRYEDIAVAFGGHGVRVADRGALDRAIAQGFVRDAFTLIVCEIDAGDYAGRI